MDIGLRLKKINDLMHKHANQDLEDLGITFSQHHVMVYLEHCKEHTAPLKDIEHHFQVAQATMAGIVKRLESKGFLVTSYCENDKRMKVVALTEQGESLCHTSYINMKNRVKELESIYTAQELVQFEEFLKRMYEQLYEDEQLRNK